MSRTLQVLATERPPHTRHLAAWLHQQAGVASGACEALALQPLPIVALETEDRAKALRAVKELRSLGAAPQLVDPELRALQEVLACCDLPQALALIERADVGLVRDLDYSETADEVRTAAADRVARCFR